MHDSFQTLRKAFTVTIPVMTGYIILGMAFGILLADKGYSFLWALLMSTTIYAGSMQFVTINLLSGGAALLSAALMTLLVNARHLIYGISMLGKYSHMGAAKPYLIFSLTDETYALLCVDVPENVRPRFWYLCVSVLNQLYWIAGSVLGAIIGSALTIDTTGIDFAMTALFVVIFVEQWLSISDHTAALIGLGSTIACLLLFGAEKFLIPSMLVIVSLLSVRVLMQERRAKNA